jgi:small subunit ribosomal protein S26e
MPKKRRNNGRNKKGRGRVGRLHCDNCRRLVPKDKAIKRYMVKDIVDGSTKTDINECKACD